MTIKRKKSSLGFSIVELMVAVAVIAILVQGVASLMKYMNDQSTGVRLRFDYTNFQNQMNAAFRSDSSCINNLTSNAVVFPAGNLFLTTISLYTSANIVVPGAIVTALNVPITPGSRLTVSKLELKNLKTLISNKEFVADLEVTVTHNFSSMAQFKPFLVEGLRISTTSGGVPLRCNSAVRLTCVTGFLPASGYATGFPGGVTNIIIKSNSDTTYVSSSADVFNLYYTPPRWGLQCKSPNWLIAGFSSSGLTAVGSDTRSTVNSSLYPNGYVTDASSIPATPSTDQGLYLTCCTTR